MFHVSHIYRSLPTHDEESKAVDPSVDKEKLIFASQIAKRKRTLIVLLGFIFLSMSFSAFRGFTNGMGCRVGAFYRPMMHRNMSISSGKFYELPSGDKIPAVALGIPEIFREHEENLTLIAGVWRASSNEVRPAVKVRWGEYH